MVVVIRFQGEPADVLLAIGGLADFLVKGAFLEAGRFAEAVQGRHPVEGYHLRRESLAEGYGFHLQERALPVFHHGTSFPATVPTPASVRDFFSCDSRVRLRGREDFEREERDPEEYESHFSHLLPRGGCPAPMFIAMRVPDSGREGKFAQPIDCEMEIVRRPRHVRRGRETTTCGENLHFEVVRNYPFTFGSVRVLMNSTAS